MLNLPSMLSQSHRLVTLILSVALAGGFAWTLGQLDFVHSSENYFRDLRIADLTPASEQHPDIVIIEITEDTLDLYPYRSPPNRGMLADLVDRMGESGARAVALDVLFYRESEAELDERLKDSIARAPMPVILATATRKVEDIDQSEVEFQARFAENAIQGDAFVLPDPIDSFVRRQRPYPDGPEALPNLAAAIARTVGAEVPQDEMTIAYRRTASPDIPPFKSYPAHTVGFLPAEWFQDKIVFIGADLPDIDVYHTPLSRRDANKKTPGVEIQAHMLAQILDGARLPIPAIWVDIAVLIGAALLGVLIALLSVPILLKAGLVILLVVAYWAGAFWLYKTGGPLLAIIGPSLALPTAAAFFEAFEGGAARKERRFIRDAFQSYVAPAVVQSLIEDPSRLTLGGERRDISTIFTDIKGFTSLSEKLPADRMTTILNEYLDRMLKVILDHDGTIDKVVGDALHCFFGAPIDQPDHAQRCYDCALALDAASEAFRQEIEAGGEEWGLTRIGAHTGNVLVGNFGGKLRFNYTAHGDAVNTAARLEGANKHLGTRVCVSRETLDGCKDALVRPIGELLLVGKEIPVATFEPVAAETDAVRRYREAYALMAENRMNEAREILVGLLAADPTDGLVAMHIGRIDRGEKGVGFELASK